METKKSELGGLTPNIAGALAYLFGFITGIFFLLVSKDKFVRFHAMQSTILFLGIFVVNYIMLYIPFLGYQLSSLINLAAVILWIWLMLQAYQGKKYKLPYLGDLAEKQVK